jgi:hypothetical protein
MTKEKNISNSFLSKLSPKARILLPWSILAVAFGLTTVLLVSDLIVSRGKEERLSRRESANIIGLTSRSISPMFEKTEILLKTVADEFKPLMESPQAGSPEVVNKRLLDLMVNFEEAQSESLRLIDESGRVLFVGNGKSTVPEINVADKSYFVAQKNSKVDSVQISDPIKSQLSGKWLISMSRKFTKDDGSFGGIAQIFLRTDYIQDILSKVSLGDRSGVSMVAADGGLVARSTGLPVDVENEYSLDKVFKEISSGKSDGVVESKSLIDGDTHMVTFRKMRGVPLVLIVGASPDDYLNNWNKKAAYYLLSWIFVSFMMGALWRITEQNKLDRKERDDALETLAAEKSDLDMRKKILAESHEKAKKIAGEVYVETMNGWADEGDDSDQWMNRMKLRSIDLKGAIESGEVLMLTSRGAKALSVGEYSLESMFDQKIEYFRELATTKGLRLDKASSVDPKIKIFGDGELLNQVLDVFLWNATRFTYSGMIVVGIYLIEASDGDWRIRVDVIDTGASIDQETIRVLGKVFSDERVSSVNTATMRLSMASQLARLMGGEIGVASEKNKGTNFWLVVPVKIA